jgi:hypothetical protein
MANEWKLIDYGHIKLYTYRASDREHIPTVIGPGDRMPTPKEIVEALAKGSVDFAYGPGFPGVGLKYDEVTDEHTSTNLPPGNYYYVPPAWNRPDGLSPMVIRNDSHVKRDVFHVIKDDLSSFIEAEETYGEIGIQYRRGLLMYGPPGEGKTTIIRQIAAEVLPDDAVTIFTREVPTRTFLEHMKHYESPRIKVFVFEELAATVNNPYNSTEELLDFLDGESSPNKSVIIGTTNYPRALPMNIVDRPSRFDLLIKVGAPSGHEISDIAAHYLGGKVPAQVEIDALDGLSTAAIKEACILHRKSKKSLVKAAEELRKRHKLAKDGFPDID